jgi:hypothetical protein
MGFLVEFYEAPPVDYGVMCSCALFTYEQQIIKIIQI